MIPMNDDGPDMDVVEAIAGEDESVKNLVYSMYSNQPE